MTWLTPVAPPALSHRRAVLTMLVVTLLAVALVFIALFFWPGSSAIYDVLALPLIRLAPSL